MARATVTSENVGFDGKKTFSLNNARLRVFLRKNKNTDCCKQMLDNREAFDYALESLSGQHAHDKSGPVTDFLQWLMDHSEQIIAFIQMIIKLFSTVTP